MARFLKDRSSVKGQAPGSMILIGRQKLDKPIIKVTHYNKEELIEKECENIGEAIQFIKKGWVTWINIYGIHDIEMMEEIKEKFELDMLLVEDILNTDQVPKYVDGENNDAFILKMLHFQASESKVNSEQISIILGKNFILSLQERVGDMFDPVRTRIRNRKGKFRMLQNDYLVYALMDTLVDNYLLITENIGKQIEDNEEKIFKADDDKIAEMIYLHKIELSYLRKNIRPMKEIILQVQKSDNSYFTETTIPFIRDMSELVDQNNESIELYSSMVSDQLNTYNSIVGNKMNQVMKVLTIFASIFIPLTFIAGIYGMNFENIPELKYKYGYFIFWGGIILIGGSLLYYFKRKKWL